MLTLTLEAVLRALTPPCSSGSLRAEGGWSAEVPKADRKSRATLGGGQGTSLAGGGAIPEQVRF